jgi:hypothetical protein
VGDKYYRYDYIRMVWPNQDYFNLTSTRDSTQPFPDNYPCTGVSEHIPVVQKHRLFTLVQRHWQPADARSNFQCLA